MRTAAIALSFAVLALCTLACFVLGGALPLAAAAATTPQPVSPGTTARAAAVEARCPTFQWAGTSGARGYELAVFLISDDGAEPSLVTRASVPGDARGFTPASSDCLERGRRYAWSVAATATNDQLQWSPPLLFSVQSAPSLDELELAIATIERYREHAGDAAALVDRAPERVAAGSPQRPVSTRRPRASFVAGRPLPGTPTAPPTTGVTRVSSAATPALGSPSLSVSANISLDAASNLFKDGDVFLWDDESGNTALGRQALASASGAASNNTAFGRGALQNTTEGVYDNYGSYNTAVGDGALYSNTIGRDNTASGYLALNFNTTGDDNTATGFAALSVNTTGSENTATGSQALWSNGSGFGNTATGSEALGSNTTGSGNTATGLDALGSNTSGDYNTATGFYALGSNTTAGYNTALGHYALGSNSTGSRNTASGFEALVANTTGTRNTASGYRTLDYNTTGSRNTALGNNAGSNNTTGNDSIFINNLGVTGDTATIRIGTQGTQTRTFVAGITGAVVSGVDVLVNLTTGQLGVAASSRDVKHDITALAPLADRLLALRPVSFRYRQLAGRDQHDDPDAPLEYGLIAEEVAEVFPELVIYDQFGKPQTVKYHLLGSLLLRALQEQQDALEHQRAALEEQRTSAGRQEYEHRAVVERLAARVEALESRSRR